MVNSSITIREPLFEAGTLLCLLHTEILIMNIKFLRFSLSLYLCLILVVGFGEFKIFSGLLYYLDTSSCLVQSKLLFRSLVVVSFYVH